MTKSIYNPADNAGLVERINKLTSLSSPLWGKMSAGQMLAHCQALLNIAFGDFKAKRGLMAIIFGKIAKQNVLSDKPFQHNLPTLKEAKMIETKDFNTEKQLLIGLVQKLTNHENRIIKQPHPFFGELTIEEWDKLQYKHLDHHLRQFGV